MCLHLNDFVCTEFEQHKIDMNYLALFERMCLNFSLGGDTGAQGGASSARLQGSLQHTNRCIPGGRGAASRWGRVKGGGDGERGRVGRAGEDGNYGALASSFIPKEHFDAHQVGVCVCMVCVCVW